MDFNEFKDYVKNNISEYILSDEVQKVHINNVKKNNGLELTAMIIQETGSDASPVIYLEGYYEDYKNGDDIEEVLNHMADEYGLAKERYLQEIQQEANGQLNNPDARRLFIRAVNYEKNKDRLADSVYEKYNDLALEVRYLFTADENGIASVCVDYKMLSFMEMGYKRAIEKAKENTLKLFTDRHESMINILEEMTGVSVPEEDMTDFPMVVITNEIGMNGATMIAYPEIVGEILKEYGIGDAYILPSSVHEIIAVPAYSENTEKLASMVRLVNETSVTAEDFLSDNVYKYDSKNKEITLANDTEKEQMRTRDYKEREREM